MKQCTYCGSTNYRKNGSYKGVQRYRCKLCHKHFSDKVRKFTRTDREKAITMYLNNVGIRKIAKFIGSSPGLIVRWIREERKHLNLIKAKISESLLRTEEPDIIEMDEIYTYVKKNQEIQAFPYGVLILGEKVALLHIT